MTRDRKHPRARAPDKLLRANLAAALARHFGAPCSITGLQRGQSAYSSSFAIEELQVQLEDGASLDLIFKDLGNTALLEDARRARPAFLHDPRREIAVYRSILRPRAMGTATCYGSVCDDNGGNYWLFLEKVPAIELYQEGEFGTWLTVARWLADFHRQFAGKTGEIKNTVPLIRYERAYYATWPRRARLFAEHEPPSTRAAIKRLAAVHDAVIERLLQLPQTVVHGDFYAANILVQSAAEPPRVCPVDWEMAAAGPGLMDLAALVSGNWSAAQERALVRAYLNAWFPAPQPAAVQQAFLEDVMYCQLHLAMRWLGWSARWTPPAEHQQDWLSQAVGLADRLGL